MSYYADYLKERTDDEIIELPEGFATYRFINGQQCYLIDIYVAPEYRRQGFGSLLGEMVTTIAKEKGCKELIGTVCTAAKNSDTSLQTFLTYGMKLKSAQNDIIILKKDI